MSVDLFEWDELADSSRGLLARPILPNNVTMLRGHVASIHVKVINRTTMVAVEVDLDVTEVMLTTPSGKNTWAKDTIGFTFNWAMPGDKIPDSDTVYQIVVTWTMNNVFPSLNGKKCIRVWKATTKNPETV